MASNGAAGQPSTPDESRHDLVVQAVDSVAEGVLRLTLRHPEHAALPGWSPGAHIDLVLDGDLVRQYSLCGDPADTRMWTVAVLREPDSRGGSRRIHEGLAVGDKLEVRGPRNHFALVPSPRYLFIAGGIGITPILPMVAAAEAAGADWRLLYGGRTRASMAFRDELERRHRRRVSICPQDETGLLDLPAALGEARPDTLVYCCGPEALLAAVERHCAAWPAGALHVERFAPRPVGEPVRSGSFEVELAESGMVLTVPADRSILQVAEEAGVEVFFSCEEGTCGTCETRVLEGVPEHRDSVLSPQERAANQYMMICVSRAVSDRLVLEL